MSRSAFEAVKIRQSRTPTGFRLYRPKSFIYRKDKTEPEASSMDHGFLIDMDGVIYRGGQLIEGAASFIESLLKTNTPFRFLTNNSRRTRRDVASYLRYLGIPGITETHVYTCSIATARFLARQNPDGTAYVIGEGGLLTALHLNGFSVVDHNPDYVVVGEGRAITYEMIEKAILMVSRGAKLIATNLDANCPIEGGIRPGCGATIAMIEMATGKKAFSVGKPSPVMMREARKELGLGANQVTMIGDTMETDILGAVQMGYRSVLVLSGGTRAEDLVNYAFQPDIVLSNIGEMLNRPEYLLRECVPC